MMDISLIADSVTVAPQQGLGIANSLLYRQNFISGCNIALSARVLQISAVIFDALAPPPAKPYSHKTARRTLLRKKRRTRRRSCSGGDEDGGEDFGFFGGDGDGDGPFGGAGGSWGGGRGWNFDRFGGQNWDESSWSSSSKFAYGFVYEVIYWIALSTCMHFAFEKAVRIMADGIADTEREKTTNFDVDMKRMMNMLVSPEGGSARDKCGFDEVDGSERRYTVCTVQQSRDDSLLPGWKGFGELQFRNVELHR